MNSDRSQDARGRTLPLVLALAIGCALVARAGAAELHVPGDYASIQDAVLAAADGDTILVGPGTWRPFVLPAVSLTIQGTGGAGVTIVDAGGHGRVVEFSGLPVHVTLRDLTLTGGGGGPIDGLQDGGGALFVEGGTQLDLRGCVISGNTAGTIGGTPGLPTLGGGLLVGDATVTLFDCTLSNNVADRGSAISNLPSPGATISLQSCIVTGNTDLQLLEDAGVVQVIDAHLNIGQTFIGHNTGNGVWHTGTALLNGVILEGNSGWGLGVQSQGAADVSGCDFLGNGLGGARLEGSALVGAKNTASNCVFAAGDTLRSAAVFETIIEHCSFDGASVQAINDVVVSHSIFRNVATPVVGPGPHTFSWCDVEGGAPGPGNFDADPEWIGFQYYHLSAESPCIDAGDPSQTDPDLSPPDVGAYRYAQWQELGGASFYELSPAGGVRLLGQGALVGGGHVGLRLTNANQASSVLLIIGLDVAPTLFKGSILWPSPDLVLANLAPSPLGELTLAGKCPSGLPPGFSIIAQAWFKTETATGNVAATNAQKSPAP